MRVDRLLQAENGDIVRHPVGPPFAPLRRTARRSNLGRLRFSVVFVAGAVLAACAGGQRATVDRRKPDPSPPARVELTPLAVTTSAIEPPKVRTLSASITMVE